MGVKPCRGARTLVPDNNNDYNHDHDNNDHDDDNYDDGESHLYWGRCVSATTLVLQLAAPVIRIMSTMDMITTILMIIFIMIIIIVITIMIMIILVIKLLILISSGSKSEPHEVEKRVQRVSAPRGQLES